MKACQMFIECLRRSLPDLVSPKDLVEAGIYKSYQAAYRSRVMGTSPPYFRLPGKGVLYLKADVLEFLKKHYHENE